MTVPENLFPELTHLGEHLATIRAVRQYSQTELADMCALPQATISQMETGKRLPSLDQLLRLARALNVSVQWFFRGANYPAVTWQAMAIQLQEMGIRDLFVDGQTVPGAFLPNEQVLAVILSEAAPQPRIVEAVPAVLAGNEWKEPRLLKAYGEQYGDRTLRRMAWLADVTLTILQTGALSVMEGPWRKLEEFKSLVSLPPKDQDYDTMGRSSHEEELPPVSRRWRIGYPADLSVFAERTSQLLLDRKEAHLRMGGIGMVSS